METFEALGLSEAALEAVAALEYEVPTPIQREAIPVVLSGRDVIAAAQTGTGKTAAFSLPVMSMVGHGRGACAPRMLVVTPTRELAQQIGQVCTVIARSMHQRVLTVVGGLSYEPQINALARGVDVLIATPGRLIDLMGQDAVDLSQVKVLVLDEADRMCDMGFLPSVKRIVAATPHQRQTLLFSATIDGSIRKQVGSLLDDPVEVRIARVGETADTVEQLFVRTAQSAKAELLKALLAERGADRVIVFVRTRHRADATCRRLKRVGISAAVIHSDRSQNQRAKALANFAKGEVQVVVATDVLARGIDISEVAYVVNYDLPGQAEDYVHRIGRTGRAGEAGCAISFVTPEDEPTLAEIEKFTKASITEIEVRGFDSEQVAAQVAANVQRKEAREDPDIAEAARELKAKERKKRKRQAKAAEAAKQERATKGSKGAKPAGRQTARGASHQKAKGAAAAKPAAKPAVNQAAKEHPKGSVPKKDFRPGRAHRAEAATRRKKNSGR